MPQRTATKVKRTPVAKARTCGSGLTVQGGGLKVQGAGFLGSLGKMLKPLARDVLLPMGAQLLQSKLSGDGRKKATKKGGAKKKAPKRR